MEIAALASFISLLIAWIVAPNGSAPDEISVDHERQLPEVEARPAT